MNRLVIITALGALCGGAYGQSSVRADAKNAWGENIGWTNWRDAGAGLSGVRLHPNFLSGMIWAENIGWISVGDGQPLDCSYYSNTNGVDYGVNVGPGGVLDGFAWAENVGWINFDTYAALSAQNMHARFDSVARRFRGFAWGENVGWINLDDASKYIGLNATCLGDVNQDGQVSFADLNIILSYFNTDGACSFGDTNGDGKTDFADLNNVLSFFNTACPQ